MTTLAPLSADPTLEHEPRVRELLQRLAPAPPQVLLLEGGTPALRRAAAQHWSCLLNCEAPTGQRPCLHCHVCTQMQADTHRDFRLLDGEAGNISIDEVRELRSVLGEPPREARLRMVILFEAQVLRQEAANALLKTLEEPRPTTRFVLCAPQRERLLPTLVSRSWVVTLGWGDPLARDEEPEIRDWLAALAQCGQDGRGWMARTQGKGAVDQSLARAVYLGCQRELLRALTGRAQTGQAGPLARLLAERLPPVGLRRLDEALAHGLQALDQTVNPALCLDWLAVTLYRILR